MRDKATRRSASTSTSPPVSCTSAFETAYRAHAPSVFRFALTCVNRRDLAEDLTSEAFLALYRNLTHIDHSMLPAWLFTVVRNRARDWWRRRLVEQRYRDTHTPVNPAPPALERWILDSSDLKPVHRTCVMLRYVYGMTRREIANQAGLTENQVNGYLQYALQRLRKAYARGDHRAAS